MRGLTAAAALAAAALGCAHAPPLTVDGPDLEVALFGSALRDDFDPATSDLDLTVDFGKPRGRSPERQYFDFKAALEALFGRPVDLVELAAMPDSRLKRYIERSQISVYGKAA